MTLFPIRTNRSASLHKVVARAKNRIPLNDCFFQNTGQILILCLGDSKIEKFDYMRNETLARDVPICYQMIVKICNRFNRLITGY